MLRLKLFRRFLPQVSSSSTLAFQHHRPFSHNPIPSPSPPLEIQNICELISTVGNLDDLETNLNHSTIPITSTLISQIINSCKSQAPTRRLLRFFSWAQKNLQENAKLDDNIFNTMIRISAEKKDFTAMDILISDLKKEQRKMETETFRCIAEALVQSGREDEAVGIFKNLEKLFKCPKDVISLSAIVHALCSKGHARKAEGVVWHHRSKLSKPIEPHIYKSLLHGWCVNGNVKEARRTLDEMKCSGVSPGLFLYNTYLRCVCKRNLKFNPSALVSDANDVMNEMRSCSVIPSEVTFNILLSCLSRVRRVKEACRVLNSMREMGCDPDWMSYYLVVRVLFLTGRFGRGNRVVDLMIESGLGAEPRFYRGLIGVLCGIDKMSYALQMFERMKNSDCRLEDYGPVYDLLIEKLCRGGEFDKGRELWDEAVAKGVVLRCSSDFLDPCRTEVFKPTRKVEEVNLEVCKKGAKVLKKCIAIPGTSKKNKKASAA